MGHTAPNQSGHNPCLGASTWLVYSIKKHWDPIVLEEIRHGAKLKSLKLNSNETQRTKKEMWRKISKYHFVINRNSKTIYVYINITLTALINWLHGISKNRHSNT